MTRKLFLRGALIALTFLVTVPTSAQFKSVRVQIIDRGQADGILIRTPNEKWVEVPTPKHEEFPIFSQSPVQIRERLAAEHSITQKRIYNSALRGRVGDTMTFFNQPPDKTKRNKKSKKRCKKTCRQLLLLGVIATGSGVATYATAEGPFCHPDDPEPHTHPPNFSHCAPGLSRSAIQGMGIVMTVGGIAALIGAVTTRTR